MNPFTEQQFLTQLRALDTFRPQELFDFLLFRRQRQTSTAKFVAPAKPFPPTRVEDGIGCVGYHGERKSLADMQQGIVEEAKRQWQREDRT
jgi:hypothetical protein